jgi:FtsJ-like methyltransferase
MEIHGNGGPLLEPILPWDGFQIYRDRTVLRTPQSRALQQLKNEIRTEDRWDDFKKITNPYEYVFLSWNRRTSRSVALRQPLSRSYFKMVEIWESLNFKHALAPLVGAAGGLKTAHAAEGPGGFIEACWVRAAAAGWTVRSTNAITLRSDAANIPGWRKAARFLESRPAIRIHEGADGTGNILIKANQDAFVSTAAGAHIYTADGGFDFSADYAAQEDKIFPLLVAEALIGLRCLATGGILVMKCFDTTERNTLDFLWLMSRAFASWHIVKPKTSRLGNAERYFVGVGRLPVIDDIVIFLDAIQKAKHWSIPLLTPSAEQREWMKVVFELQERIEREEYRIIRATLDLIHAHEYPRLQTLVYDNVTRSIEWCKEYGEAISAHWQQQDIAKNIGRECRDLIAIIRGSVVTDNGNSWYNRLHGDSHNSSSYRTGTVALSFEGFRSNRIVETSSEQKEASATAAGVYNPFRRFVLGSFTPSNSS